jgi:hypothetical protein
MAAGGQVEIKVVADTSGFDSDLKGKLQGAGSAAESVGKGIGLALAAGAAVGGAALAGIISVGSEFENTLANIKATTGATDSQMQSFSKTAQALGSDVSLSGVSANDAASAMLELSKAGLSVTESQTAAKSG